MLLIILRVTKKNTNSYDLLFRERERERTQVNEHDNYYYNCNEVIIRFYAIATAVMTKNDSSIYFCVCCVALLPSINDRKK